MLYGHVPRRYPRGFKYMTNIKLDYDPDFDEKSSDQKTDSGKGLLDNFSPKTAFVAGLVLSVLVLGTVGFFVLLGWQLKDGGFGVPRPASARSNSAGQVAQAPRLLPTPTPTDAGGAINIRPVDEKTDHIRGNKNAKITLVEFSDLECPFCKRVHPTMQRLLQDYDGKVAWVYRHFPLRSLHSKAAKEAEATECASEQGKFWEYTDKIFEVTPSNDGLDLSQLPVLAEQVGLNKKKFEECLSSGKFAAHVSQDEQDAVASGGRGTPHTVILTSDGKKIPASGALPYENFKAIIDPLL